MFVREHAICGDDVLCFWAACMFTIEYTVNTASLVTHGFELRELHELVSADEITPDENNVCCVLFCLISMREVRLPTKIWSRACKKSPPKSRSSVSGKIILFDTIDNR